MSVTHQSRLNKKPSGGRYRTKDSRKKRKYELGNLPALTTIDKFTVETHKTKSRRIKSKVVYSDTVNVFNPSTKKYEKTKIKTVVDNPGNRHFIRRNIMTKGAVVSTDLGKVKITSRPGQHGTVNGILVQ